MHKPIVVVGPLEDLMRSAFLRTAREQFDVVEIAAPLCRLRRLGVDSHVAAVVLQRVDAADGDGIDANAPLIGLSSVSGDVLVIDREGATHLDNPTPEMLCDYIASRQR